MKRSEAKAYPNGTRFQDSNGNWWTIEKPCGCGDHLHYEAKRDGDISKYGRMWDHEEIIVLPPIIFQTGIF